MAATSRRLRAFNRWMKSNGVECSDAIQIIDAGAGDYAGGISVRAVCDLSDGDLVATIPKSACITIKTSGARELIESAELGGTLGLAVALMYERSRGPSSPWYGYLQLLPETECVPIVWGLEEVETLLVGTELHKIVKQDKKFLIEDWKESIEPLILSGLLEVGADSFSVERYFSARSLVSSRSFQIDDYHGSGMVPVADLFNHKTGAEDVHFTNSSPLTSSDDEDESDISNEPADNKSSNSSIDLSEGDLQALEMIVIKYVEAGSEVFNTYGLIGNAALLHRYGFTEPDNQYDIINIDLNLVTSWCSSSFSSRYTRACVSLWRKLKFSGCISQDSEYFEVSFDGKPQLDLLVLLYIMFLKDDVRAKLGIVTDNFGSEDESTNIVNLIKFTKNMFPKLQCDEAQMCVIEVLMTENVCRALVSLANMRDSLYGLNSLDEDVDRLKKCSRKERKLYHSLVLRICERRILARLREFVLCQVPKKKRKSFV